MKPIESVPPAGAAHQTSERGFGARAQVGAEHAAAAPGADHLVVRDATEKDFDTLDAWALASPRASFWHRPGWLRAVRRVFGNPDATLVALRAGRVVGMLPLARTETLLFGTNLVSVPYGVYGGVAGDDPDVEAALMARARATAEAASVGYLELRHRDARVAGYPESALYVTFERELPPDPEQALAMLPRKARAAARQGRDKHGLEFDEGLWFLDDFYDLFSRNKRHLGSPPLPRAFFHALVSEFRGDVRLHAVRHRSKLVAGVLSFTFGKTLLPYYSGGLSQYEPMQCNNFLYWKLMEWGSLHGCRAFDFGRSRVDTGPYHFKKNQGFEPQPLHYGYHLVRSRSLPKLNPGNPAFDLPRRVWQRLPLRVHEVLGATLSRYLP